MKIKITIISLVALFYGCLPGKAQSVKDVTDDTTGRYIYAQARDENPDEAFEMAVEELEARVNSYVSVNKMSEYNLAWKEWMKRIVNEKYGRTRVFLFLSVSDLMPDAMANVKPEITQTESEITQEKSAIAQAEPESVQLEPESVQLEPEIAKVEPETVQFEPEIAKAEPEIAQPESESVMVSAINQISDAPINDVIERILKLKNPDAVLTELQRGKNLRLISMYSSTPRKNYIKHAFIVTSHAGQIHVYSPENAEGLRVNFDDDSLSSNPEGNIIYWFIKK